MIGFYVAPALDQIANEDHGLISGRSVRPLFTRIPLLFPFIDIFTLSVGLQGLSCVVRYLS